MKGTVIATAVIAFFIGFMSLGLLLEATGNQKGILEDYALTQYDESLSYLTATIYNPEIDEHRVFTVRHRTDNPIPALQPFVGQWINFGITADGATLHSIDTSHEEIWNRNYPRR